MRWVCVFRIANNFITLKCGAGDMNEMERFVAVSAERICQKPIAIGQEYTVRVCVVCAHVNMTHSRYRIGQDGDTLRMPVVSGCLRLCADSVERTKNAINVKTSILLCNKYNV